MRNERLWYVTLKASSHTVWLWEISLQELWQELICNNKMSRWINSLYLMIRKNYFNKTKMHAFYPTLYSYAELEMSYLHVSD